MYGSLLLPTCHEMLCSTSSIPIMMRCSQPADNVATAWASKISAASSMITVELPEANIVFCEGTRMWWGDPHVVRKPACGEGTRIASKLGPIELLQCNSALLQCNSALLQCNRALLQCSRELLQCNCALLQCSHALLQCSHALLLTDRLEHNVVQYPASGRGAGVSACADLTDQLQSFEFKPNNIW